MATTFSKQLLSSAIVLLLMANCGTVNMAAQQAAAVGSPASSEQPAPLSANELQKLVAPIALYPDALVAQVLGAATFPDQVAAASLWLAQNQKLTGEKLMKAVDAQPWDPSIKALTQFPTVLDDLAKNLSWTSSLGEAYHLQSAAVMTAVQTLRAQAKAAGNLKSGSQITVVQESPQTIVIQPTNPQVVYVPQYNPSVVYGTTYVTPGYSTAAVVTTGLLAFGAGIAIGAMMNNSCCGWGYSYWNCNWHGGAVYYGGGAYYGNTAWRGGAYGSTATAYGPYGSATAGRGYNPSTGTYGRGATASSAYGTASAGQAYNPYTGARAQGATASNAYGSVAAGSAYNPSTGAAGATRQASNAYGNYGSSVATKNGEAAYTQHQTTAQGSAGSIQTTTGAKGAAATGANGSAAVGQTANGNKYAASSNGNVYQNNGSGWQQTQGTPHQSTASGASGANSRSTSSYSGANSAAARGYGGQERSGGESAFGGGGGWQSRQESARGFESRGGGGGFHGRR
jgi:hypothetical protein